MFVYVHVKMAHFSFSGYDTMSVTTSPGTRGSSEGPNAVSPTLSPPPQVTLHVPPLPPLGEHTDPVALIDARIKVLGLHYARIKALDYIMP